MDRLKILKELNVLYDRSKKYKFTSYEIKIIENVKDMRYRLKR